MIISSLFRLRGITSPERDRIRRLHRAGRTVKDIAKQVGRQRIANHGISLTHVTSQQEARLRPAPSQVGRTVERQQYVDRRRGSSPLQDAATALLDNPDGEPRTVFYQPSSAAPGRSCRKQGCGEVLVVLSGAAEELLTRGPRDYIQGADAKHGLLTTFAAKQYGDVGVVPICMLLQRQNSKWPGLDPAHTAQLLGLCILKCEHQSVWQAALESVAGALPCDSADCTHPWVIQTSAAGVMTARRDCTGDRFRCGLHVGDMHKAQWGAVVALASDYFACDFHNYTSSMKFGGDKLGLRAEPSSLFLILVFLKLFSRARTQQESEVLVESIVDQAD